jgi:hypothetical protein
METQINSNQSKIYEVIYGIKCRTEVLQDVTLYVMKHRNNRKYCAVFETLVILS